MLVKFTQPNYDEASYGIFTPMGKQLVYRYFEPIRLMQPCLACHGKPKGKLDMLGFLKKMV